MNTVFAFFRKLIANLIWAVLIAAIVLSWKAYGSYRENDSRIQKIRKQVADARKKRDEAAEKIKQQTQLKKILKRKIIETGAQIQVGNILQSCRELTNDSVQYIQNEINGYGDQKEYVDSLIAVCDREKDLTAAQGRMYLNCWEEAFRKFWIRCFAGACLTVFLTPFLIACLMYYGIAWFVEKRKAETASTALSGNLKLNQADARIRFLLPPDRHLYLRAGWCKSRKNAAAKTKLLWRWSYPLVSIAADLCELIDFSSADKEPGEVVITAPVEDLFIGAVDLNHGELVIRPRYLIGITDDVAIRTHWDFSIHSIFSGRIRKIILCGSGTVFLAGSWGVEGQCPKNGEDCRIEYGMLLGYESGAKYSLCRTETFWHYFRRKADLFDIRIRQGTFLTQNNAWSAIKAPKNNVDAVLKFFLDGIFSILGL